MLAAVDKSGCIYTLSCVVGAGGMEVDFVENGLFPLSFDTISHQYETTIGKTIATTGSLYTLIIHL
jgi:hypothetical protein